jgi:hypothetical protein
MSALCPSQKTSATTTLEYLFREPLNNLLFMPCPTPSPSKMLATQGRDVYLFMNTFHTHKAMLSRYEALGSYSLSGRRWNDCHKSPKSFIAGLQGP